VFGVVAVVKSTFNLQPSTRDLGMYLISRAVVLALAVPSEAVTYETKYFDQPLDHFGFFDSRTEEPAPTLAQRYLINTDHWVAGGPILFYAGNEGDITDFANNTGFMWEQAPVLSAMVVFAEERYYGESLPSAPYNDTDNFRFLSSQQVRPPPPPRTPGYVHSTLETRAIHRHIAPHSRRYP
jgi:hypothetical protein